ncbi:MAG: F0F1 ATP synthase subunit A [Nitrospira sp.]|nr:F0F1 ATP synthase subunit A [Nitrospira sp.]
MPQFESHFFSSLIFWEVVSFAILFFVLYKFAFPGILSMLEEREKKIKDSLDQALVVGFMLHGVKFLGVLIPPGTPGWLVPLMIPIEIMSQLARPISLAVRLFANMTAGHVLLGVLFGMAISGGLLIGWLPFVFTVGINVLEVGIAFIQAYIFTMLSCVYLGDAFHLHGHDDHAH